MVRPLANDSVARVADVGHLVLEDIVPTGSVSILVEHHCSSCAACFFFFFGETECEQAAVRQIVTQRTRESKSYCRWLRERPRAAEYSLHCFVLSCVII